MRLLRSTDLSVCFSIFAALLAWLPGAGAAISDRPGDWLSPQARHEQGGIALGPVDLRPRVSAMALYDDNIYITERGQTTDYIWIPAPGVAAGVGDYLLRSQSYLMLDWTSEFWLFTHETGNNTVEHHGSLAAEWRIARLALGLRQGYDEGSYGSEARGETGNRLQRTYFPTLLDARYELSPKTSLNVQGEQRIEDYEVYLDGKEWVNTDYLNYQFTPKLNAGFGAAFGYRDIEDNPSQTYERALLRARYELTGKTSVDGYFGGELRQFHAADDRFSPVFSLAMRYLPKFSTTLGLEGYRREQSSSLYAGQNYTTTGVNASIRQRFLKKTFVVFGGGYEHFEYYNTTSATSTARVEDYFFVRLNLEWYITRQWLLGAFGMHRENDSNVRPFSNNQVGIQSAFIF